MHSIDNSSSGADGAKLGDVNGDGLTDLVVGWEEGGITKVYLHPGSEKVTEAWPNVIVGKTPSVEDAVFIDINRDGVLDVVSCTEGKERKIYVHLAPKPSQLLRRKKWEQYVLPASDGLMKWMYAEPIHLEPNGKVHLVAAGKDEGGQIGWFESSKDRDWEWHSIGNMGWVMSIVLRDVDRDGDQDIVVSDRRKELQASRWLENPGDGEKLRKHWESHVIGAKQQEVMFMSLYDIDDDGKEEAIVCERTDQTIRIYQKEDELGLKWNERVLKIPGSTGSAKSVEAGDLDLDGKPELVLSTNTNGASKVGLTYIDGKDLSNDKTPKFIAISGSHNAKYDKVELIDMDLDGDLDVLTCEENFGENSEGLGVIWYENPFK